VNPSDLINLALGRPRFLALGGAYFGGGMLRVIFFTLRIARLGFLS
jgi:hypothetical protein